MYKAYIEKCCLLRRLLRRLLRSLLKKEGDNMDLLKEYITYYLHSMVDMIGEENFLKICKMYGGSSIYIIVQTKKDTINLS